MSVYRFKSLNCQQCGQAFNVDQNHLPMFLKRCAKLSCLSCSAVRCGCENVVKVCCARRFAEWVDALTKMDKLELSEDQKNYQTDSPCQISIPQGCSRLGDELELYNRLVSELTTFQNDYLQKEATNLKKICLEKGMELERCQFAAINCSGCKLECSLEELFNCKDCKSTICNTCLTKGHEGHETVATKSKDMSEFIFIKTTKRFDALVAGNERNIRVLNTDIGDKMKEFQAAAQAALDRMKLEPERSVELAHQVNEAADEFERICEKAYPVTRKMNDEFDTLITQFAKICPKPEDVDA